MINWNKYQSKGSIEGQNQYLHYFIDPRFLRVNRFFVLAFENSTNVTSHAGYYLPKVEIKGYSVKIDGRSFFISLLKSI